MAFRRFSRRRSRRGPTQWHVTTTGWDTPTAVAAGATPTLIPLMSTYAAGAAAATPPAIQRLTIQRIRGQLVSYLADPLGIAIHYGIYVADVQSGGTVFTTFSPINANDADKSWLWFAHALAPCGCFLEIDVKVKRVIRADQVLVLACNSVAVGAGAVAGHVVRPYVRSLVGRVA